MLRKFTSSLLLASALVVPLAVSPMVELPRTQNVAVSSEYKGHTCSVDDWWIDTSGIVRHVHGSVTIRMTWTRDTRGSDRDVSWVNWTYNPSGGGSGEGPGISAENNTNYALYAHYVEMRNIAEVKWAFSAYTYIGRDKKVNVAGHGDEDGVFSYGDFDAHSYWDNAPRVTVTFAIANYPGAEFDCSIYPTGQPST
jgi:hypothetical protein